MAGENRVDRGSEPHQAAAQIEGCDLERQDRVVSRDLRWGAARYRDIWIGHPIYLEARAKNASVLLRHDLSENRFPLFGIMPFGPFHRPSRHQANMPFWACNRFSAS